MAAFLTEEWFAMAASAAEALPKTKGVDAHILIEAKGAPAGKWITAVIVDGQFTELALRKTADAECTIEAPLAFAEPIVRGSIDPEVAYMRGDVKLGGAYEQVLVGLRPMTGTDAWTEFVRQVASATD